MAKEALIDRLGSVAIFRGLNAKELHRIAEVGKEVHFEPGAVVAQQDGGAAGFHLIMDGENPDMAFNMTRQVIEAAMARGVMIATSAPKNST